MYEVADFLHILMKFQVFLRPRANKGNPLQDYMAIFFAAVKEGKPILTMQGLERRISPEMMASFNNLGTLYPTLAQ
jgi:hypothetical protein